MNRSLNPANARESDVMKTLEAAGESIKYYVCKLAIPFFDANSLKQFVLWVGALTGYLLGKDNYDLLLVMLTLIILDWITGIGAAIKNGQPVQSLKIWKTAVKIMVYLSLIITAQLCGARLGLNDVDKLLIAFYIATEAYSIIENADKMGFPVPALFKAAIKGKLEESENKKVS